MNTLLPIIMLFLPLFVVMGQYVEALKWSQPVTLGVKKSTYPNVAIDPNGNAIAAWTYSEGNSSVIKAAKLPMGGTWSKPVTLTTDKNCVADDAVVVMDKKGNAVAVWTLEVGGKSKDHELPKVIVQAATLANGSDTWIPADQDLSSTPSIIGSGPKLAVDDQGNAVAVWAAWNGEQYILKASKLPFGSSSWLSVNDHGNPDESLDYVDFALDRAGNAVAVWEGNIPGNIFAIKTSNLAYNSLTWSDPVVISEPNKPAWIPYVVVDKDGNALATWHDWDNITKSAKRSFGSSEWVRNSDIVGTGDAGQLVMDPQGNAILLWTNYDSKSQPTLWYSTLSSTDTVWAPSALLSPEGDLAYTSELSVDPSGNALFIWVNLSKGSLQGATLPFGKNLSKPFFLSSVGSPYIYAPFPSLALSANGKAVIVYPTFDKALPKEVKSIASKDVFSLKIGQ